ncbi:MAG: fibronectin type III domain-containing protein [Planctomycetota bacterium]
MDPAKVAKDEVRMWHAYYAKDFVVLRQELKNLLCSQFGISDSDANYIGEPLTNASLKFEAAETDYDSIVLPYIELAYSRLKQKLDVSFDPKEVAGAELDWWVARRTPGSDSVEEVGRLIARLYVLLFGEENPAFDRAGLLRAQAARLRDEGGALCDWDVVEQLLHKSYQALQEGIKTTSNNHSAQVAIRWDPNQEENIAGYIIYYGNSSGDYGSSADVGNRTNYTVTGLESGNTYYFVITAYNNFGSESNYSAEIALKATVVADETAIETITDTDTVLQEINLSPSSPEIVWLPQEINLTRRYKGPFSVKIRIEGVEKLETSSFFPRLKYYIGTGSSVGYFDMKNEEDGVWRFDIPDPGWFKYRSKYLYYQVKIFGRDGNVILESSLKVEFIDSFFKDLN